MSLNPLSLKQTDPELFNSIELERTRQEEGIELIASENYVSKAVLEAQGSILTNKYAEGYPSKRYYGGCEFVDQAEDLAIKRASQLFSLPTTPVFANVQPHSGSQANMAVYFSLLKPGEKMVGMSLAHGGHLTHGSPVNFSGKLFQILSYGLNPATHRLDYDLVRELVSRERPKVLVAGASAYSRVIDFAALGSIAREFGAEFVVDMAHIAGLVATGLHPSPFPHARFVTTTTHKTLRGPRGGMILCSNAEDLKLVNSNIFPGIQGGPLMHVIAAKAVAFKEALEPSFKSYQTQVLNNARTLAEELQSRGFDLVTGGTDNHLILVDLTHFNDGTLTGKDAEKWLDQAHITVNKNSIPGDLRSPFITSGIRVGTPAITSRGFGISEMKQIANWMDLVLRSKGSEEVIQRVSKEVKELCGKIKVY